MTDQPATEEPTTDEQDSPVESVDAAESVEVAEDVEVAEPVEEVATPEQAPAAAAPVADNHSAAPTATAVLTHVVRSIVDDADAVQVDAVEGRNRLKLEVKVGPGDLGRVIGRRGRTAQSIRTVVRAAATRDGVEVDVDFVD
ncbi:MAG TPA: KH domain-containing protein [Ilumatobacteraceae bacterium]|nr:KH domain-containing protein [Ilumatobacteraceae bacterium]